MRGRLVKATAIFMAVLMLATGVPLDALAQETESGLSVEPEEITAAEITEAETMSEEAEERTKAVLEEEKEEELLKRQQEIYEQKIRKNIRQNRKKNVQSTKRNIIKDTVLHLHSLRHSPHRALPHEQAARILRTAIILVPQIRSTRHMRPHPVHWMRWETVPGMRGEERMKFWGANRSCQPAMQVTGIHITRKIISMLTVMVRHKRERSHAGRIMWQ